VTAIRFFDMAAEVAAIRPDLDRAIARVLDHGGFVGGAEVERFERALAAALGVGHAVGTSSGTDALLAIAMALGWGRGDRIVTTPLSFFATVGAIARVGARPVFADVDDALTLDPDAAAAAVDASTRAIVTVHLFGRPAAWPTVAVPVIEDAAQSIGAGPVRGRAAALSFFPTKNLGACGDAGAVLTDDADLADRIALPAQPRRAAEVPPRRDRRQPAPRRAAGRDPRRQAAAPPGVDRGPAGARGPLPRGPGRGARGHAAAAPTPTTSTTTSSCARSTAIACART
jgi:hypothetical protein